MRVIPIIALGLVMLCGMYLEQVQKGIEPEQIGGDLIWNSNNLLFVKTGQPIDIENIPPFIAPLLFQKIPVNKATTQLLETIPGIGPELAGRIVSNRLENGEFISAADLRRVDGIGEKRQIRLQEYLYFD